MSGIRFNSVKSGPVKLCISRSAWKFKVGIVLKITILIVVQDIEWLWTGRSLGKGGTSKADHHRRVSVMLWNLRFWIGGPCHLLGNWSPILGSQLLIMVATSTTSSSSFEKKKLTFLFSKPKTNGFLKNLDNNLKPCFSGNDVTTTISRKSKEKSRS